MIRVDPTIPDDIQDVLDQLLGELAFAGPRVEHADWFDHVPEDGGVSDLLVAGVRMASARGFALSVALTLLHEARCELDNQRKQIDALRSELRRYVRAVVKGAA